MSTPIPQTVKVARENYRSALEAQAQAGQAKTAADQQVATTLQHLLDTIDEAPVQSPSPTDPEES